MSVLPSLLRLAGQLHLSSVVSQPARGAMRAVAVAACAALPPPLPAPRRLSSSRCSTSSSSVGSSTSDRLAVPTIHQQRRAVAAAAGRRGNVFLDDSAQPSGRGQRDDDDEPGYNPAKLFDSSRFNYDSDEDEELAPSAAAANQQQQQHGTAAAAAGAAAAQQARRAHSASAAAAAAETAGAAEATTAGEEDEGELAPVDIALPPPRATRVKTAEFIKSSVNVAQCPPARYPEFAVIGRSNVGKSSLINMLTGRSSLAMVSKTPGKTRCINHFLINGAWYLVDLPGYGYARTSKGNVVEWNRFTREYFLERDTLVTVLLLVDASIPPLELDISCAAWFAEAEIPFTVVFTKLDKRKKGGPPAEENIAAFEAAAAEACGYAPPSILTSSRSGRGRGELLAHVAQLRDFWNKQNHGL